MSEETKATEKQLQNQKPSNINAFEAPHTHADGTTHTHADGTTHTHSHGAEPHAHVHDPAEKKRQLNRLSRAIGHMQYVKRMIENDEDCAQVLIQISAIQSALNGLGKQIISEHITHCITHAMEEGDTKAVEDFQHAIEKFL